METLLNIPVHAFKDASVWANWLAANHADQTGVWIKIAKKDSKLQSITYSEALDEALCYGWIDGQRRGYSDTHFLQKFTPRRKRSLWSKVNIEKVSGLIAAGRMQTPGQAAIDAAKADGRWDAAYDSQRSAVEPPDLLAALSSNKTAKGFYETLTKAERYSVLHQLMTAPNPTVRTNRLDKTIAKLQSGQKV